MKKILSLILASIMLVGCFGCFAGCSGKDDAPAVSATDPVPSASDVSATDESVVDEPVVDASATDVSATDASATDMGVVNIEGDGEYFAFLAIGADKVSDTNWANSWAGEDTANAGVTASAAKVNAGDSFTLSVEFTDTVEKTWYLAPCIVVGEGKTVDATVTAVRLDGKDVTNLIDFTAGDAVWYEGTGSYTAEECVRLGGGYNEWATQYLASDILANYNKVEFDITLNAVA